MGSMIFVALLLAVVALRTECQFTINKTGCFKTKGCISFPSSCSSSDDCDYLLTYASKGDHVVFELSSKNEYAGFGLNTKKAMDGGDAIVCSKLPLAYNTSRALVGHYLLHHHNTPSISKPTPPGLTHMSGAFENGRIFCRFHHSNKAIPPFKYNLTSKNYFLYSRGYISSSGGLTHHVWRDISEGKQSIASRGPVKESSDVMKAIHAGLMLLAWICLAPIGMFTARNMKLLLANQSCCLVKQWFQVHRGCMMLVSALTIGGFVVIFINVGGWSKAAGWHAIIGTAVLSLTVIQTIVALFRPSPEDHRRSIFNWIHRCIACIVFVLAISNCFLGVNLFNQSPLTSHLGFVLILSFIVGFATIALIYETYSCCYRPKNEEHSGLLNNDHNNLKESDHAHLQEIKSNKVFDVVFYLFIVGIAVGVCATLISLLVLSTAKQLRG
ncbi:putative ferric-chelate reductase 1 isoform X2 [Exaiptasia diaphana]|uniref:Cytochrome b561 domain-containing protein n=1 Tax=Exaiptasia diaphana TaxID=2652724 RepID=A0A913WVJ6_EXADI|nr:putative ferric-chelate reductase 1 isoform X2 [Exaiptasia diaphana]